MCRVVKSNNVRKEWVGVNILFGFVHIIFLTGTFSVQAFWVGSWNLCNAPYALTIGWIE